LDGDRVSDDKPAKQVGDLLETPNLAGALESDRFKQFLDRVPVAIAVSELEPSERIVYANLEFERLTGQTSADVVGQFWNALPGAATSVNDSRQLGKAVAEDRDYTGTFDIEQSGRTVRVDAWSNVIQDDDGAPVFRLVALVEKGNPDRAEKSDVEQLLQEKDTLLRELQHRVKNNLQMITALIRLESRNLHDSATGERFDRLAGRIEALGLLYDSLSREGQDESIDLGVYLSQVASAVMRVHAPEGVRLDLKVDTWPVSINVAMPAGLVVNELLTNSLKHAFGGRDGGTVTLHSLVDRDGCRVIVADDGRGLDEGTTWPSQGKLGALIVQSLRQNARADIDFQSTPGKGVRVTIRFQRADAAPSETS
jgi:PAS domain S-box-containing protein